MSGERHYWAAKAHNANDLNACMGNPQLGDCNGCPEGSPVAAGMHHGRCQYCQDLFNMWRLERYRSRRDKQAREGRLWGVVESLRGRRLRWALWVLHALGYELDMVHFGPRCVDRPRRRRRAGMMPGYGDRHAGMPATAPVNPYAQAAPAELGSLPDMDYTHLDIVTKYQK